MSVANFIPELWSDIINETLKKNLVFGNVVNTTYEGQIRNVGDTVRISTVGPVTIGDYTGAAITAEELDVTSSSLEITNQKYFNFQVDDVDAAQAAGNVLDGGMVEAAYGLRDTADQYIAGLYGDAGTTVTSTAVNSANVYAAIAGLAQKLDEANCPVTGRWLVIPAWMKTKLSIAMIAKENSTNEAWTNGFVGDVAGFKVYWSNNIVNDGTTYQVMAGHPRAIAFAAQLRKVEAYRKEAGFKDGVKGIYLFGAKVVSSGCLATLQATVAAES